MAVQSELIVSIKEMEKFAQIESEILMRRVESKLLADIYAICIPSKKRTRTQKLIRDLRKEQWDNALKQAQGDENEAIDLLLEAY